MSAIRKAAVSGQFYPSNPKELRILIESFMPKETVKTQAKGIIVPHAGYIYSGRVAVATVSQVFPKSRLILLGPNHTGMGKAFSLWAKGEWQTPLADIAIDEELAAKILEKGTLIQDDEAAHRYEHSLEVQLPILYCFFNRFSFVPITCQSADLQTYKKVADQIFAGIKDVRNEVFFVASTDLTHYEPDATARAKDRLVIEAILNLDEESLINEAEKNNITMCGIAPVAIFITCLKNLGARKAGVALYQTSADTSGDYNSVVGYAGMVIK